MVKSVEAALIKPPLLGPHAMKPTPQPKGAHDLSKTVLQVAAILCLCGLLGMIFHKAYADIGALAHQHRGADFWAALARYLFRNLAGG